MLARDDDVGRDAAGIDDERLPRRGIDAGERRVAADRLDRGLRELAVAALDRRRVGADARAEQEELPVDRRELRFDARRDAALVVLETLLDANEVGERSRRQRRDGAFVD